jgi:hypothetical protein
MITYHDCEQGTFKWKLLREGLWTGSKAIRLLQGKSMPVESDWDGNDATRRGHALESVAIMEYERKYRTKVERIGFITNSVYPNAGYSPDGIAGGWLLEVKAFNGQRHEDLASGKIPLEVLVQIYFGMIITGKRKARLLAFNPEYEQQLTVMDVEYDKVIGYNIRRLLKADMKKRQLISETGA